MLIIKCWSHPNARRILWYSRSRLIFACRDPKNRTSRLNGRKPNSRLQWSNPTPSFNAQNPADVFSKSSNSQDYHFWAWRHPHSSLIFCLGVYCDKWWWSYPLFTSVNCTNWLCTWTETEWFKALPNWMIKYNLRKMIYIKKNIPNYITHITHFSINFTWFVLLNHQEFDDRPLLKFYTNNLYSYTVSSIPGFNGISNLLGLFNAKDILLEEQQWCYLTHSEEDKGVHIFPKGICPNVNVIAWLEFELAYYDSPVQGFNNYTTRTPTSSIPDILIIYIVICF